MDEFEQFCHQVSSYVNRATSKERKALEMELREHLEDRSDALSAQDCPEEQQMERAVASMGDPEVIGRELNKQLSRGWLIVSRTALIMCVVLTLMLLAPIRDIFQNLCCNWIAQYAPELYMMEAERGHGFNPSLEAKVLDTTIRLYRVVSGEEGKEAYFYLCAYADNPFQSPIGMKLFSSIYVSPLSDGGGGAYYSTFDSRLNYYLAPDTQFVRLHYNQYGQEFSFIVSLNGGEVS